MSTKQCIRLYIKTYKEHLFIFEPAKTSTMHLNNNKQQQKSLYGNARGSARQAAAAAALPRLFPLVDCGDETCFSVTTFPLSRAREKYLYKMSLVFFLPKNKTKQILRETENNNPRQDAVVPHSLVVFSISFSSFSGFPATMKGHVCGGESPRTR